MTAYDDAVLEGGTPPQQRFVLAAFKFLGALGCDCRPAPNDPVHVTADLSGVTLWYCHADDCLYRIDPDRGRRGPLNEHARVDIGTAALVFAAAADLAQVDVRELGPIGVNADAGVTVLIRQPTKENP
jgi:hypothetical protein